MDKEIRSHPVGHPYRRPSMEAEEGAEEAAIKEATKPWENPASRVDLEDLVDLVVEAMTLTQKENWESRPVTAKEIFQA